MKASKLIKKFIFAILLIFFLIFVGFALAVINEQENGNGGNGGMIVKKPAIYLYPKQREKINITLNIEGTLTKSIPSHNYTTKGWSVIAYPDGHLISTADGKEYPYLFWEARMNFNKVNMQSGFVVAGSDTKAFLKEILPEIGLIPAEYNEFINYWSPEMEKNKFNFISFDNKEYLQKAPLIIEPTPDSVLRVFMTYKPLEKYINIPSQNISSFTRTGFTVVEWGGSKIN